MEEEESQERQAEEREKDEHKKDMREQELQCQIPESQNARVYRRCSVTAPCRQPDDVYVVRFQPRLRAQAIELQWTTRAN